jgi:DnaK suppressor protein
VLGPCNHIAGKETSAFSESVHRGGRESYMTMGGVGGPPKSNREGKNIVNPSGFRSSAVADNVHSLLSLETEMMPDSQFVKQLLESKLNESANLLHRRDSIEIHRNADLADATQQAIEREMACRDLDRNALLARDIRAALQRIADGSYGYCTKCDEPIPEKRIAAVPWTALCLSCQEKRDATQSLKEEFAA